MRTHDARYLSILAATCAAGGVAIEAGQQRLIARVFDPAHAASRILARLRLGAPGGAAPSATCGVLLSAPWYRDGSPVPIEEFCGGGGGGSGPAPQAFLIALVGLYCQLCLGRNYNGIKIQIQIQNILVTQVKPATSC